MTKFKTLNVSKRSKRSLRTQSKLRSSLRGRVQSLTASNQVFSPFLALAMCWTAAGLSGMRDPA